MKVLALDYGAARTGVAVSDATGTLARPLGVVERATTNRGLTRIAEMVEAEAVECVVVGMPFRLTGERGMQALETEGFLTRLREVLSVPVDVFDERFTTALAQQSPGRQAPEDARAAAHLLTSYLTWITAGRT